MKIIDNQIGLEDIDPEYAEFLEKFKPKKTTDDCYTPPNIYEAVLDWVVKEYGIDRKNVVRPFWPGANYEKYEYPDGCTVVDNPPFSIITKICKTYSTHGIKFFLFAPYLTNFQTGNNNTDVTHIITGESITYENGARVDTAFVTNLDAVYRVRAVPDLSKIIKAIDMENTKSIKPKLPKYKFPRYIVTAAMCGYMAKHDTSFSVKKEDAVLIKVLDAMRSIAPSGIFGGGYLLGEKAAAEKAAAEKAAAIEWELSDREIEIVSHLGGNK